VQRDQLQAEAVQDLLPRFAFMPDGRSLIYTAGNRLWRLSVNDGRVAEIPFRAAIALELGPTVDAEIRQDTGPVRARLIQAPEVSPDGRRLAFSALGRVYVQDLGSAAPPALLTIVARPVPSAWPPDGRAVFVT
jgi:hypothetical protein